MEELVNVQHSLYGWQGIIQSFSFGNGICQISSDVCPDKGKRTTLIASVIDKLFNGTHDIALGEMQLTQFDGNFSATQDYHGYHLIYAVRDFNNLSNSDTLSYAK